MFNTAIIINIMRSAHTSSRLMMWPTCRQEVGRPLGREAKPPPSCGRRLGWRVFVLGDEKIRQLSAVALSSRPAALHKQSYHLNEAASGSLFSSPPSSSTFFSLSRSIDPSPRCSDNNIIEAELHPQEHFFFSPPVSSGLLYVSIMCVIPRGSGGDNRGDLLCSVRCRPWASEQRGQSRSGAPASTKHMTIKRRRRRRRKASTSIIVFSLSLSLNGLMVWLQTELQIHLPRPRTFTVCFLPVCLTG